MPSPSAVRSTSVAVVRAIASQSRSGHRVSSLPIGPVARNTAAGSFRSRKTGAACVARLRVPSSNVIAMASRGQCPRRKAIEGLVERKDVEVLADVLELTAVQRRPEHLPAGRRQRFVFHTVEHHDGEQVAVSPPRERRDPDSAQQAGRDVLNGRAGRRLREVSESCYHLWNSSHRSRVWLQRVSGSFRPGGRC